MTDGSKALFAVICAVCLGLGLYIVTPTDDSDGGVWSRSGVNVIMDHKTGCQYLQRMFSGMTPRLDGNGKQICNKG